MDSNILNYWDLEAGGALFMSEPIQNQYFPQTKSEIEQYNPIMNSMPSWLPNALNEETLTEGVTMEFARLPGPGYEALHPRTKGY